MTLPYKSVKDLLDAAKAGELPEDFTLTLDNDSVSAYMGGDDDWEDALDFDLNPREFLEEVMEVLGIRTERP